MSISALWGPVLFVARWETPAMRVLHDQARTLDIPKRQSNCKLGLKDHKTIYPMLIFPKMIEYWWCEGTKKYSKSPKVFKFKFRSEHFSELRSVARDCARVAWNCARVALSKSTPNLSNFSIFQFLYVLYESPEVASSELESHVHICTRLRMPKMKYVFHQSKTLIETSPQLYAMLFLSHL